MWEVVTIDLKGDETTKIVSRLDNGMRLATRAIQRGRTATVKPIYFDFYVVDEDGKLSKIISRTTAQKASAYAAQWTKMDQESGCLMWPHGLATPSYWNVAEKSELDVETTEAEAFTDILIPHVETGVYVRVATRLDAMEASEFSVEYAKHNRNRGCMLWPHGAPTPSQWTVLDGSDE